MSARQFFILNSFLLFSIKLVWQKYFYPQNPHLTLQAFELLLISAIAVLILREKEFGKGLLLIYLLINAFIFLLLFIMGCLGYFKIGELILILMIGLVSIPSLMRFRKEYSNRVKGEVSVEGMPAGESNSASLNQPAARTYQRDALGISAMWFNRVVLILQVPVLIKAFSVSEEPWTSTAIGIFVLHFLITLALDISSKTSDVKVGHNICAILFFFVSLVMFFILLQAEAF